MKRFLVLSALVALLVCGVFALADGQTPCNPPTPSTTTSTGTGAVGAVTACTPAAAPDFMWGNPARRWYHTGSTGLFTDQLIDDDHPAPYPFMKIRFFTDGTYKVWNVPAPPGTAEVVDSGTYTSP